MNRTSRLLRRFAGAGLLSLSLFGSVSSAQERVLELPPVMPETPPPLPPSKSFVPPVEVKGECAVCEAKTDGFDFKKLPNARVQGKLGNAPTPPADIGYYTFVDALHGNEMKKPPKYPYGRFGLMPPGFFDADFRYLDDPKNTETDFFDTLKRIHIGDDWMFSTGGMVWNRYMDEDNSRLTNRDNTYNLSRARVYGDLWYKDQFRVYAEFIAATSSGQELASLPVDQNKGDFLNLFVDVKLTDDEHPAYLRIGRQELYFGSQRLISSPDWINTRRNFDGIRGFRQGEKFDVDVFWTQPVIPNANRLDSVDNNVNFGGIWTTYRPKKGTFLDVYYLFLDNTSNLAPQGIQRAPATTNTIGSRFIGDTDGWLYEAEAAIQLGSRGPSDLVAGMASVGAGRHFKDAPLTPTFWIYYDYASGDKNPNMGNYNTFNQLFPFGHYYLGWIDQVGRQNIHDINAHLFLYPTNWVTLWTQYHHFRLDSSRDALYNAAGVPTRRDPTGRAGKNVGDEIDFVANFHISNHMDILTGYSYLFGGGFLEATKGQNGSVDSSLFYLQTSYRW